MENMTLEQTHTLVLVSTYLSGAEEWLCPTCGHRILKTRLPQEQLIVLVNGEEPSKHDHLDENQTFQTKITFNVTHLAPWLDWIDKIDFDQLNDDSAE